MSEQNKNRCLDWLKNDAFPLWFEKGRDENSGAFHEGLDYQGVSLKSIRRCMIQWRQVYCFSVAYHMDLFPKDKAKHAIESASNFVLKHYSQDQGGFAHAIDSNGVQLMPHTDLYNQAFCLFGLSCVYSVDKNEKWKNRAKTLLQFLLSERKNPAGGFTETDGIKIKYESNPHMHLLEALLAWVALDSDPLWSENALRIIELCEQKFIDSKSKFLAEHFHSDWRPIMESNGFIAEPGHHYEWSWLLSLGDQLKLKKNSLSDKKFQLFEMANQFGVCPKRKSIYDEIYSDGSVKISTSRYWPPCEKIKAAIQLATVSSGDKKLHYLAEADTAMDLLFQYLDTPLLGISWDKLREDGSFSPEPPRASAFYHIVCAMKEYVDFR
jgi:mannose/cellobiose epimerase-like protein (N-acyl-D-glucosamine 2-epimerase family)